MAPAAAALQLVSIDAVEGWPDARDYEPRPSDVQAVSDVNLGLRSGNDLGATRATGSGPSRVRAARISIGYCRHALGRTMVG